MPEHVEEKRANSVGVGAAPMRGVPDEQPKPDTHETDKQVSGILEEGGREGSMWWAGEGENRGEGGEDDILQMRENLVGVSATPARGVHAHSEEEQLTHTQVDSEPVKKRRQTRIEEVEDEGDVPPKLRTQIYMRPEEAWPHPRTNSLGARATPGRGVPNEITVKGECNANHRALETKESRVTEEMGMKNEEMQAAGTAKQTRMNSVGVGAAPARGVESQLCPKMSSTDHLDMEPLDIDPKARGSGTVEVETKAVGDRRADGTGLRARAISVGASATPTRGVQAEQVLLAENATDNTNATAEYEEVYDADAYTTDPKESVFTRATDPFNPRRVARIVEAVQIGPDLTDAQRAEVRKLVMEHADIFALAVSEVFPVAGAVYAPKIPLDKKFSTKIHQRPVSRPQAEYLHEQVEILERAGIICPIHPRDVKCVSPIKLAEKEHEGGGLTHEELKHALNDECIRAGLPAVYDLPPRPENTALPEAPKTQKWRICQNFHELNELLKVVPFPQGDIRDKQRRLSGHRYISIFDFASGVTLGKSFI
jgi:hypothetical protein